MNTGQMLLVIGALVLLSVVALSVNSTLLDNDQVAIETQSSLMAISLCQGVLENLAASSFDALSVGISIDTLVTPFAAFVCTTQVDFVNAANPDLAVADSTGLKRLQVAVSNDYITGSIAMRTIVGDY